MRSHAFFLRSLLETPPDPGKKYVQYCHTPRRIMLDLFGQSNWAEKWEPHRLNGKHGEWSKSRIFLRFQE
jgi:hypothetical protein